MKPKEAPIARFADIQVGQQVIVRSGVGIRDRDLLHTVTSISPKQFSTGRDSFWKQQGRGVGRNAHCVRVATLADIAAIEAREAAEKQRREECEAERKAKEERLADLKGPALPEWAGYVEVNDSITDNGYDLNFTGLSGVAVRKVLDLIRTS